MNLFNTKNGNTLSLFESFNINLFPVTNTHNICRKHTKGIFPAQITKIE